MDQQVEQIFPSCWRFVSVDVRDLLKQQPAANVPASLQALAGEGLCAEHLCDLARIEYAKHCLDAQSDSVKSIPDKLQVNPALELVDVAWTGLLPLLEGHPAEPDKAQQYILLWIEPDSGQYREKIAAANELLALKIVVEELDPLVVAKEVEKPVGAIDRAIDRAVDAGLLLKPASLLRREGFSAAIPNKFLQAEAFTLQWHITHRCDLHCRHCYDRSRREDVSLAAGVNVLDQMRAFCLDHHVYGQVSFSGGNPFLHPGFYSLYQAACERNLSPAILGNPVSEQQLDQLLAISKPGFFQVSLEGLEAHNDEIRGAGNYAAVIAFLELLKRKNVYSMVMLTLTQTNLSQVLPLAEELRGRVDLFTYNRLSMVGEGASLESPRPGAYRAFVEQYLQAQRDNPSIALKDSLINIEREKQQLGMFGGCTGFGCGAAFNFVSLLPDGQVHACRKFPSPIGDLKKQSLQEVYRSVAAQTYRDGCQECSDCRLRVVCGGCLAVAYGCGLDPLQQKDPACFIAAD